LLRNGLNARNVDGNSNLLKLLSELVQMDVLDVEAQTSTSKDRLTMKLTIESVWLVASLAGLVIFYGWTMFNWFGF